MEVSGFKASYRLCIADRCTANTWTNTIVLIDALTKSVQNCKVSLTPAACCDMNAKFTASTADLKLLSCVPSKTASVILARASHGKRTLMSTSDVSMSPKAKQRRKFRSHPNLNSPTLARSCKKRLRVLIRLRSRLWLECTTILRMATWLSSHLSLEISVSVRTRTRKTFPSSMRKK